MKASALTPMVTLNDGHSLPQIGLGVWQLKNNHETEQAVRTALETGYKLIDTAAAYGNEQAVGRTLKESSLKRDQFFVTTKLWNADQGKSRTEKAFFTSLSNLQLDYIDLYLIHWPTPRNHVFIESWKILETLQKRGYIKSIGVSNFSKENLEALLESTDVIPAVNQLELHPGFQQRDLRKFCQSKGIALEAWSPLGGQGGTLLQHETLQEIATTHNKSSAQIVLRWHIQKGHIAIPKSSHPARIQENNNVFDFALTEQEIQRIDSLETNTRQGPNPQTLNSKIPTRLMQLAHQFGMVKFK